MLSSPETVFLLWLPAVLSTFRMDLNYSPDGTGSISIVNSGRYFNRPLYGAGNGMLVMAGDRPIAKGAASGKEQGTLMVALSRRGRCGGWAQLDPNANTTHFYRPGSSSWSIVSSVAPELELRLQVAPTDGGLGMAMRVSVLGAVQPGDRLLWFFAGMAVTPNPTPTLH